MGTPPFAATSLARLLDSDHHVAAVVTRPDRPRGRGLALQSSDVKRLALEHSIEVLEPRSPKDRAFLERLCELAPDLVVVVAYGRILPPAVLATPRLGCINAHASLLPKLRGAAPIERAILEGHDVTGVTIMRMDEGMDTGDMITSERVPIGRETDAGSLRATLAGVAADLLVRAVDAIAAGHATYTPQDDAQATYAPPLDASEAKIDWSWPARDVDLRVRAFTPRPGAFTFAQNARLKVLAGRALAEPAAARPGTVIGTRGESLLIACGRGVYAADDVQPEGRRPMSGAAWARGSAGAIKHPLGADD